MKVGKETVRTLTRMHIGELVMKFQGTSDKMKQGKSDEMRPREEEETGREGEGSEK